jgi:hypothetical protein
MIGDPAKCGTLGTMIGDPAKCGTLGTMIGELAEQTTDAARIEQKTVAQAFNDFVLIYVHLWLNN